MSAKIYTLFNQKGGVGKTTSTYYIADAASARGLKTLIVDIDPQGNLTKSTSLGPLPEDIAGLADALTSRSDTTAEEILTPTIFNNVNLLPTPSRALSLVRDELLVKTTGRETALKKALKPFLDDYDLILIDCPPSIDTLTLNALVASNGVIIVTQAALWSVDGIAELLRTVHAIQEDYNEGLEITGILINLFNKTTNSARQWRLDLEEAAEAQGIKLFYPPVPQAVRLKEIAEASTSLQATPTDELAQIYNHYLDILMGEEN
ncbi:ParA family protein [Rothia nasimurium]|uniref:ParA family protein n=1 Tax=Rothia nasimurium TaxID=85336 RepID=UPI001F460F6A|nr:ParA family protein [Rothia nasimurium]